MQKLQTNTNNICGALKSKIDIRDYKLAIDTTNIIFPEEFELEMGEVKNQLYVSSCVAHAISEVVEYHTRKQEDVKDKISTGFIYGNRRNTTYKGPGMYIRNALENVVKYGAAFKADFPENREVPKAIDLFEKRFDELKDRAYLNRFSGYFRLYKEDEIKYALLNYGPVVISVYWYGDYKVKDGILQTNYVRSDSYHCIVIYGWNKDGWKIQNSWGTFWGDKGRAILPYKIKLDEAWGVTDDIIGEDPNIKRIKIDRRIVKIINWSLNTIFAIGRLLKRIFKK